jgi:hypothetical protein
MLKSSELEMHLEPLIDRVWIYALGVRDRVNLEAVIMPVLRETWRL